LTVDNHQAVKTAFYASLAVVPWVIVTLLLRWLISIEGWPVGLVGTLSRLVTLPVLAVWIVTAGAGWRSFRPRGRGGWLILMGLISIVINLTWFSAVQWTTATNVGMLIRFDVIFVILIGAMLGVERIGLRQLALIPLMFVGLALLMEVHKFDWGGHIVGDSMTIVTALGFSVNAFVIRHIMVVMHEEPVAFYNHSISMLGFIALAMLGGDFAQTADVFASPRAWPYFIVLGVLVAVSLPLYYVALRRMDVWKLRTFMLSTPVLTLIVERLLWRVELAPLQWLGGAIILAGLAVLIRMELRLAAMKAELTPAHVSASDEAQANDGVPNAEQFSIEDKIA
jgi:drug/metabolite transporter (DMT)-like permease